MKEQIRVNITTTVNKAAIRREKRNGRDVIIVSSATMPDDVIMNGVKYPAAEIKKGFSTLERSPAPFGHPTINGEFVSAKDPEGLNLGWIGAWNENVRQEGGRVLLDKVIDVARANESEKGKAVLAAIDAGEPVHTSTGLLCMLDNAEDDTHKNVARALHFDHDAILLEEEGAATPEQGVGMMVNSKGEKIRVVNSIYEDAERDMDWAVEQLARALDKRDRVTVLERIKAAILGAVAPARDETSTNGSEDDMDKDQIETLSNQVNGLVEAQAGLGAVIANAVKEALKPLTDSLEATALANKAKDDAELEVLRTKIVNANMMGKEAADTLSLAAARELAKTAEPGKAYSLNSAFNAPADTGGFQAPKGD